jgi:hypothetical protein
MHTFKLIVAMFSLGTAATLADTIHLADGSTIDGELGAPAEITVKTPSGEKRVAFALLPPEVQKQYWRKAAEDAARAAAAESSFNAPVTDEDLAALANEVNLDTWAQAAAIGSFRDKPEKRGQGGLVATKAFNAIEENWVSVYSPKDSVGQTGNWDTQVSHARALEERAAQFVQKRWLEVFIKAGEALGRRDSNEFALLVRELKRSPLNIAMAK